MSSNNLITVNALDFDSIKASIKTYLEGQSVFSDYNFEGSALSTLIDVLAYNTHYNALYTNLAINEQFIDSASKYQSVVSLAKSIGYTAKSIKAATAKLEVIVSDVPGDPSSLTMPKGTVFKTSIGDKDYNFVTLQSYTVFRTGNGYTFEVDVSEGNIVSNSYTNIGNQTFIIPSREADISTLSVAVYDNASSTEYTVFNIVDDLLSVRGIDNVFFVKQREDLFYEVYFGNGVIGKAISPGNIIVLEYLVTQGDKQNGANSFQDHETKSFYYSSGFRTDLIYEVTSVIQATNGAPEESIESIKFNAPRAHIAQSRAVTVGDYKAHLIQEFPSIESVSVWGGQDNYPPKYGYVFISAKPYGRDAFTLAEKQEFKNFLKSKRQIITVQHEFVNPKILQIGINTTVYYNENRTTRSVGDITALVRGTIAQYNTTLNKFDAAFRFSRLGYLIDSTERQIVSNITNLFIRYKETEILGSNQTYEFTLNNPIFQNENSFITQRFYVPGISTPAFISDDGLGVLKLYTYNSSNVKQFIRNIGTINYSSGSVSINDLNIISLYDTDLHYTMIPASNDIIPTNQYILTIPDSLTQVIALPDSLAAGASQGGLSHTFANSR